MKYPAILEDFFAYLIAIQGKSERTAKAYGYDLMLFFKYIETGRVNKTMDEITDAHLCQIVTIAWIKKIKLENLRRYMYYCQTARGNSAMTRARKVASIKAFYAFLKKNGYIKHNIASDLEAPKLNHALPVYLTVDEANQLLKGNDQFQFFYRNQCILIFLLHLGLRVSELTSLNMDSIDHDVLRVIGKGNKEREVVLNQVCLDALQMYINKERTVLVQSHSNRMESKALFLSRQRKRLSVRMVQRIVKQTTELNGVHHKHVTPHKLRHSFATQIHNKGVSIRTLQHILGHASIATTQIYTHVSNQEIRKAMNVDLYQS